MFSFERAKERGAWYQHGLYRRAMSNTCYINSLMVGLRSLEPFSRTLLSPGFVDYFQVYGSNQDLVKAMHVLFRDMLEQNQERSDRTDMDKDNLIACLLDVVAKVDSADKPVERDRQGDPAEVLVYLVDWLNESLDEVASDRVNGGRQSVQQLRDLLDQVMISTSEQARCQCGHKMGTVNKTLISLPLNANMRDIQASLDSYFSPEDLDAQCSGCSRQVNLKKSSRIDNMPEDIFILSLNLFSGQVISSFQMYN